MLSFHHCLKYDWLTAVEVRPGVYEKIEEQKIFTSSQTYEWHENHCTYCHRTLHTKFSVMYKVSNVLAERFIQDQLELPKLNYPSITSAMTTLRKHSGQQQQAV